jgi:hypothetical protein
VQDWYEETEDDGKGWRKQPGLGGVVQVVIKALQVQSVVLLSSYIQIDRLLHYSLARSKTFGRSSFRLCCRISTITRRRTESSGLCCWIAFSTGSMRVC